MLFPLPGITAFFIILGRAQIKKNYLIKGKLKMSPQVNNPNEIEAPYLFHGSTFGNQKSPLLAFLQILSEVGLFSELSERELEELSKASAKHNLNQKEQPGLPIGGDNALALATELQALLQIKSIKKVAKEANQETQVNDDIIIALKKIERSPDFMGNPAMMFGVMQMEATMKAQYKSEKKDTKKDILRLEAIINALIEHDKEHKHPSKNGHDSHGTSGHK